MPNKYVPAAPNGIGPAIVDVLNEARLQNLAGPKLDTLCRVALSAGFITETRTPRFTVECISSSNAIQVYDNKRYTWVGPVYESYFSARQAADALNNISQETPRNPQGVCY